MICRVHPRYKATSKPRRSVRFPNGCPDCWVIWRREDISPELQDSVSRGVEDVRAGRISELPVDFFETATTDTHEIYEESIDGEV